VALEGLDRVEWGSLEDAYGAATEVPTLLRKLLSKRARSAEIALEQIGERINHQGHATPLALTVVPFLVELLREKVKVRAGIAALLGDLAAGGSHVEILRLGLSAAELAPTFHAAVAREVDSLLPLLEGTPSERAAAGLALGVIADVASAARVEAWLDGEEEALPRTSALLCLGLMGVETDAEQLAAASERPEVRAAALVARAVRRPAALAAADLDALVALLQDVEPQADLYWGEGDLRVLMVSTLVSVSLARGALGPLWRALDVLPAPLATDLVTAIVGSLFPPHAGERLQALSDLSAAQRDALDSLLRRQFLGPDARYALRRAGLFASLPWLNRLLGNAPRGPMDGVVQGEPWWRLLNDAVNGRRTADALADLAERHLDPTELVAWSKDAVNDYPVARRWPLPGWGVPDMLYDALIQVLAGVVRRVGRPPELLQTLRDEAGRRFQASWCAALLLALPVAAWRADDAVMGVVAGLLLNEDVALAMRQVLGRLPAEVRRELIAALPFKQGRNSSRGATWARGAWWFVDLDPTRENITRTIMAIRACPKDAVPDERIAAIFAVAGEIAVASLESALAEPDERNRLALERALRAAVGQPD